VTEDLHWLAAAASLAARARPLSRPNPAVGAIVVKDHRVVGHGWTQTGGRPHAEAIALKMAGAQANGATLYVTLEPCAHQSERGPACADLVTASGLSRVVVGCKDPDPRTAGDGIARIAGAGIKADLVACAEAEESLSGYLSLRGNGRPHVTLKLAMSLDGCIALANGESQWITGTAARSHCHAMRAKSDAILVGGGTLAKDTPQLNVRLPGLESRSPDRWVLTSGKAPSGWQRLAAPDDIRLMADIQYLYVEGGARTAASFLASDLIDRITIYRAPIIIGNGLRSIDDIGLGALADAHDRWQMADRRQLGSDQLEVYERARCLQA